MVLFVDDQYMTDITVTLPFIQAVPGDMVPRNSDLVDSSATLFPIDQDHLGKFLLP